MTDFTHSLALVIGIDAYGHGIPRLTTAVNDATRLAELLRAEHGYETILLTEPEIRQPVTLERLRTLFKEELPARLGEDDRLLVYFAGHGIALDGEDGPRGYLVPQDARPGDSGSMLAMTDLHAWLTALPCRHMLAILDCCFAGAFRWSATRDLGALPDVIHKERYDRYLLSPAWQVLTSAAYDQKALDVLGGNVLGRRETTGRRHSPFALSLFDALEKGDADLIPKGQGDGVITATELYLYLREQVEVQAEAQASHEQTPGLWPLNKHRKGEFIFLAPGHPLNLPPAPDLTVEFNPYRGLKSYDQRDSPLFFGREDEIEELAALVNRQPFVAVLGASGTGKSSLVKAGVLPHLKPIPPAPFPPREGGASYGAEKLPDAFGILSPPDSRDLASSELTSPPGGRDLASSELPSPPGGRDLASSELTSPPGGRDLASSELPSPPGGRDLASSELPSPPGGGAGGGVSFAYQVLSPMRPTDQPVRALEALLRAELGGDPGELAENDDALAQIVARWAEVHRGQQLVLTIDQFEELVTLCRDDAERARFLALLATAVEQQPNAFRLIITLRTDFEPQFTQERSPLAGIWQTGRYIVPPMDIEDLRQVIEGPASVRVLYFDPPELVDELIKEVIQTPGALPLLSFTLSELYVKYVQSGRDDRALSGAVYKALGGVVGSLRNRATEEYDRLPDDAHRATMQRVMLRMVAVEGGGELARRRVALSELEYPTEQENIRVRVVLDWLVEARLLVRGTADNPDGSRGEAYVEPAHDALVLAWDKLLRWKKEAEEYLPLQRRLAQAAGEWSKAGPEARLGLLWDDDPRLPQVEETLWPTSGKQKGLRGRIRWTRQVLAPTRDAPHETKWLNEAELAFVLVSVQARARFWRRTVSISATVMVLLAGLAIFAFIQRQTALNEAQRAHVGELTARSKANLSIDPELSILLASSALSQAKPEYALEAQDALREALQMSRVESRIDIGISPLNAAAFRADGSQFAVAGPVGKIEVRDTLTGDLIREFNFGPSTEIFALAFSPRSGALMAVSDSNNLVSVWDVQSGQQVLTIEHDRPTRFLDFSPDERMLVTQSEDAVVRLWDITAKMEIARQDIAGANGLKFSPDGKTIAVVVMPGSVSLWDGRLNGELHRWDGVEDEAEEIWNVAISIDNQLAVGSSTGKVYVWDISDVQTPTQVYRGIGHKDFIFEMAFSPHGECLATTSNDHNTILWDKAGNQQMTLLGHQGLVDGVAFLQTDTSLEPLPPTCGSRRLATISFDDHTVRTWNIDASYEFRTLATHQKVVEEIEFSPDGRYLVSVSDDGTVQLWSITPTFQLLGRMTHSERVEDVDFSPDGQSIVTASWDRTAKIWDVSTQGERQTLEGHVGEVYAVAFRPPDGRQIATGGQDGRVILWDSDTGAPVDGGNWPHSASPISSIEFNQDGTQLVAGSTNGFSHIVDIASGKVITLQLGLGNLVYSAIFQPDGQHVVTTSLDGRVRLWDISGDKTSYDHDQDAHVIAMHQTRGSSVDYSQRGELLATGAQDGRIFLLNMNASPPNIVSTFGSKSPVNSVRFSPDGRLLAAADDAGMVRLYIVERNNLVEFARGVRVTRRFSPDECKEYRIQPPCPGE